MVTGKHYCSLNTVAKCHPIGPILFIRDVKNLEDKHLQGFFKAYTVLKNTMDSW